MRRIIFIIAILFSGSAFAGESCTCKYKDQDVQEGDTICMKTPNGSQMATCSRVLNNTSWKFLGTSCPTALLDPNTNQTTFDIEIARKALKQS